MSTQTRRRTEWRPLTEEERDFAAQNEKLIWGFMRDMRLDQDEWYGMLAESYLKAVITYNPKRSRFSTYAYMCMRGAVSHEFATRKYQKNKPPGYVISLDDEVIEGSTAHEVVADPYDDVADAEFSADLCRLVEEKMTSEQQTLFLLRAQGYTLQEISEHFGWTREWVRQKLLPVRKMITKHLAERSKNPMQETTRAPAATTSETRWMWTQARRELVEKLLAEGKDIDEIEAAMDCPHEKLQEYLKARKAPKSAPRPSAAVRYNTDTQ